MKSIMEEASSVAKAIEKGWVRAGKPQEFSVKVFEEAQKNFIGMTTKSAKVGLFFEENSRMPSGKPHEKRTLDRSADKNQRPKPQQQQDRQQKPAYPNSNDRSAQDRSKMQQPDRSADRQRFETKPQDKSLFAKQEQQRPPARDHGTSTSPWSPELVDTAQEWLKGSLSVLGQSNVTFAAEVERYALRVTFPKLITQNSEKEKMLFRSWAYLLMQALRQKYKRPLKGLKVILMSNA
jgi:predicted RNA-binding protein Jag